MRKGFLYHCLHATTILQQREIELNSIRSHIIVPRSTFSTVSVRLSHRERIPRTFLAHQMNPQNPDAVAAAAPMITVCRLCCKSILKLVLASEGRKWFLAGLG
jgi:hypothetical protein